MNNEELIARIEKLAEDATLTISAKKINKLVNLIAELTQDPEVEEDEIIVEINKIAGVDEEDWTDSDFSGEICSLVFDLIEDETVVESDDD